MLLNNLSLLMDKWNECLLHENMRPNLGGLFSNSKISLAGPLPRWFDFDLGAFQRAHERPSRAGEPWHIEIPLFECLVFESRRLYWSTSQVVKGLLGRPFRSKPGMIIIFCDSHHEFCVYVTVHRFQTTGSYRLDTASYNTFIHLRDHHPLKI